MSYQYPEIVPRVEVQSTRRMYRTKDSRYHMKGSRCTECGQLYYPPGRACSVRNAPERTWCPIILPKAGRSLRAG